MGTLLKSENSSIINNSVLHQYAVSMQKTVNSRNHGLVLFDP